jgi:hypothetical protein
MSRRSCLTMLPTGNNRGLRQRHSRTIKLSPPRLRFRAEYPSLLQFFSREFNRNLWHYAVVLQHPSLPRQVGGNRKAKNVSVPYLVCAAAQ